MKKLPIQFYKRKDVLLIAKELIGKIIVTNFNGIITSGRIVETEAYIGLTDRASHSFGGKRTTRNEHMYSVAGTHMYISVMACIIYLMWLPMQQMFRMRF